MKQSRRKPAPGVGARSSTAKRLFAAILLPPEAEAHLDEQIDATRTAHPELRWVRPARWHLTCEFLGYCGPHETDRQLSRWERRARRTPPLRLALAGVGTFPKPWLARVLWVGLDGDVVAWSTLAGYGEEPHLTLARTRQRADLTGLVDALSSYRGPDWTAGEVCLVESRLGAAPDGGPQYTTLERFELRG